VEILEADKLALTKPSGPWETGMRLYVRIDGAQAGCAWIRRRGRVEINRLMHASLARARFQPFPKPWMIGFVTHSGTPAMERTTHQVES